MGLFLRMYRKLFSSSRAWVVSFNSNLYKILNGLTEVWSDLRAYIDARLLDLYPESTDALARWEGVFGFQATDLTEEERRQRLAGAWSDKGGQSLEYIQEQLHTAGFEVYLHEWWETPVVTTPILRNPIYWLSDLGLLTSVCGDPSMECGHDEAYCNAVQGGIGGYPLVNRYYEATSGQPPLEWKAYAVPNDPNTWPLFMYVGAEVFGSFATVVATRKLELETLLLKLCPARLWVGMMVDFYNEAYTRVGVDDSGTAHTSVGVDAGGTEHTLIGVE